MRRRQTLLELIESGVSDFNALVRSGKEDFRHGAVCSIPVIRISFGADLIPAFGSVYKVPAKQHENTPAMSSSGEKKPDRAQWGGGTKPRILYVTPCWPHDRAYGGQLRSLHVARALAVFGDVSLAVIGADPVDDDSKARTKLEFPVVGEWGVEPLALRGMRAWGRLWCDVNYVTVHGLALTAPAETEILSLIRTNYDVVWFFQLRTANFFRSPRWANSVVDVDNLPSASAGIDGPSSQAGVISKLKQWLWQQGLRRQERRLGARFDVVAVCSEADRGQLGGSRGIQIIPNGFERPPSVPLRQPCVLPPRIGFIGLLDYGPNREGVRWFLDHCWPALREKIPGLVFRLAGKGADSVMTTAVPGVEPLGWVEDAAAEIATWTLMVIPIRSGAGTRIKISDAFSRQCPVVSTRPGAYGYEVSDGRQLRLADTPEAFTRACLELIGNPAEARAMAERAWEEFLEKWTWEAIAPKIWESAQAGINSTASRARNALAVDSA